MPVINLIAQSDGSITIPVPGASPLILPKRRIRAWVKLGNEFAARQAIVDTGGPYCIITRRLWTKLDQRGQIDWIAFPPASAPIESLPTTRLLGEHRYRIGRVRIQVTELSPTSPAIDFGPVLSLCFEDDVLPDLVQAGVILGLGGILNGRTMIVQVSESGDRWSAALIQP